MAVCPVNGDGYPSRQPKHLMETNMNIYAINGSPRKNKNTGTLLQSALEGFRSAANESSVETEIIHLYDLDYRSCISCLECKREGGKSQGRCVIKDSLTPVLERLAVADGIIIGSPIYFGGITGKLHSFLERFLFQYLVYDSNYTSLAPKRMPTAFIYTMNVTKEMYFTLEYDKSLTYMEKFTEKMFSKPQIMHAFNTVQIKDYAKYNITCFSESEKLAYRESQFPLDCQQAFHIGAAMVGHSDSSASKISNLVSP